MLEKIGRKRFMMLAVMALLVAALAGAHYGLLQPRQTKLAKQLRGTKANIAAKEKETQRLRADFEKLDEVKFRYNEILRYGFFGAQDRVFARNKIREIQNLSGVLAARYQIKPIEVEADETIEASQHKLLKSPIEMEIEAFSDVDVYKFIYYLEYGFPGRVVIRSINFQRKLDVTVPLLQSIGSGQPEKVVTADIDLDWYTVAPDEDVPAEALSQGGRP
jgi:hypothetical protein